MFGERAILLETNAKVPERANSGETDVKTIERANQ